jgi:hypothetical protein
MIILEKSICILSYKVNPKYFDQINEVHCEESGRNYWVTAESDSYIFTFVLSYYAGDKGHDESFLEFKSRLVCRVKIEDAKTDARQILTLVKELKDAMGSFIKKNSLSYYSKLKLVIYEISEPGLTHMESSINRLREMVKFEDKSERQKEIEQKVHNMEIKVLTTATRINSNEAE